MIPNAYHKAWDFGNTSSAFHLKLCGSGGGGFLLGFARDYEQAREELGRFNIKPVTVYQKSASKILNNQG
jgi:mevalonate kinase